MGPSKYGNQQNNNNIFQSEILYLVTNSFNYVANQTLHIKFH